MQADQPGDFQVQIVELLVSKAPVKLRKLKTIAVPAGFNLEGI